MTETFESGSGFEDFRDKVHKKFRSQIEYICKMHIAQRNSYSALSGTFRLLKSILPGNEWVGLKRVYLAEYDVAKLEYKNESWLLDTDILQKDVFEKNSRLFLFSKPNANSEGFRKNFTQLEALATKLDDYSLSIKDRRALQNPRLHTTRREAEKLDVEVRWTVERTFQNVLAVAKDEPEYQVRDASLDLQVVLSSYLEAQDFIRAKGNIRIVTTETAPLCNALLSFAKEHEHEEVCWKKAQHYFKLRYELLKPDCTWREVIDAFKILASQTTILAQEVLGRDGMFLRTFIGEADIYEKRPHFVEKVYVTCVFGRKRLPGPNDWNRQLE